MSTAKFGKSLMPNGPRFRSLELRDPLPQDADQVREAQQELAGEDFDFALGSVGGPWDDYLAKVAREREGVDLAPGRVAATMLLAVIGDEVVGRLHIRHELTPALLSLGGHIGYGVRPAYRRRGYATEMLRQGLEIARGMGITQVLVTCDDDHVGSIRTIEGCGGVLENTLTLPGIAPKRRYWIDNH